MLPQRAIDSPENDQVCQPRTCSTMQRGGCCARSWWTVAKVCPGGVGSAPTARVTVRTGTATAGPRARCTSSTSARACPLHRSPTETKNARWDWHGRATFKPTHQTGWPPAVTALHKRCGSRGYLHKTWTSGFSPRVRPSEPGGRPALLAHAMGIASAQESLCLDALARCTARRRLTACYPPSSGRPATSWIKSGRSARTTRRSRRRR